MMLAVAAKMSADTGAWCRAVHWTDLRARPTAVPSVRRNVAGSGLAFRPQQADLSKVARKS
jgi:hypothetical protein